MRLVWTRRAADDLAEIHAFIANEDPVAAFDVIDRIRTATGRLGRHPVMGRIGRVAGTREFVVAGTPFVVAYCVERRRVSVLRVLRGTRRWPPRL